MATTVVTCRQWQAIMKQSPRRYELGGADHPAEGLSWDDARSFCTALTDWVHQCAANAIIEASLPTEAEWEYACRAGTDGRWFYGDSAAELVRYAWFRSNSSGHLHPVARLAPNPWGLYDVYGNVDEWCLDEFRRYGDNEVVDPIAFNEAGLMKIVRGGDFASTEDECRSAARAFCDRMNAHNEPTGIRPVLRHLARRA
jgi:formylglycine-generating enzyme required for sulfatase activity